MSETFETKVFGYDGTPFGALYKAEEWLRENGYSVGSMCIGGPQAIVKGDVCVAKWRNLTADEKATVDGILEAGRDQWAVVKIKAAPWKSLKDN